MQHQTYKRQMLTHWPSTHAFQSAWCCSILVAGCVDVYVHVDVDVSLSLRVDVMLSLFPSLPYVCLDSMFIDIPNSDADRLADKVSNITQTMHKQHNKETTQQPPRHKKQTQTQCKHTNEKHTTHSIRHTPHSIPFTPHHTLPQHTIHRTSTKIEPGADTTHSP